MQLKKMTHRTEFYIFLAIVVFAIMVQARSGQFFTNNNIVDVVRSLIVPAMFCIGEMVIILSGGIDVSFPVIASLSMYLVCTRMIDSAAGVWAMLLAGLLIGLGLGAVNGFLIGYFRFPALIITLGTTSLYSGILHGALSAMEKPVPDAMYDLGKAKLFTVTNEKIGLSADMPVTVIFLIALVALTYFLLNKTMLGRGIYAIGGDVGAAQRAGFKVLGTYMFLYCFSGAIAGFAGVTRAAMILDCHPSNLNGMEMTVIAACVLGGVRVVGGQGTLPGTLLGIGLITVMSNSLTLLGISMQWQKVFMGMIILIGTGVTAIQAKRSGRMLTGKLEGEST
jgi:simple sugar transport system permease protein